ncbi:hypothetical protein FQZ97_804190 [compost metagenome]
MPFLTHPVERTGSRAGRDLQSRAGGGDHHEQRDPGHGRRQVDIGYGCDRPTVAILDDCSQFFYGHCKLPADGREAVDDECRGQYEQHRALHRPNRNTRLLDVVDRRIEVGEHPYAEQHGWPDAGQATSPLQGVHGGDRQILHLGIDEPHQAQPSHDAYFEYQEDAGYLGRGIDSLTGNDQETQDHPGPDQLGVQRAGQCRDQCLDILGANDGAHGHYGRARNRVRPTEDGSHTGMQKSRCKGENPTC